ncbi:restriction endonuclease [Candidatus Entotheonella palauensis]|uniref:restriction endonuclease n=1 Tax=Candidatus Entotheonella palauensis TaxID=93172 RepID=UPI000B7E74CB
MRKNRLRLPSETPLSIVECKNWSSPVPQKEISALATKARLDKTRLVFILSVSGFTRDARQQAERIRQRDRLSLVLINGQNINEFLSNEETTDDFLQRMRRFAQLNVRTMYSSAPLL